MYFFCNLNYKPWYFLFVFNVVQARSLVLRFGGAKYIFRGERFLLYCMFKITFSGNNKIWGTQKKFGGELPPNHPRAAGLLLCLL